MIYILIETFDRFQFSTTILLLSGQQSGLGMCRVACTRDSGAAGWTSHVDTEMDFTCSLISDTNQRAV